LSINDDDNYDIVPSADTIVGIYSDDNDSNTNRKINMVTNNSSNNNIIKNNDDQDNNTGKVVDEDEAIGIIFTQYNTLLYVLKR
jgi:hypothetical protein